MGRTKMTTITNTATRECLKVNETSHIEVAGQKDQNVYPIEDKNYSKPILFGRTYAHNCMDARTFKAYMSE